jgi:hypothetical protein
MILEFIDLFNSESEVIAWAKVNGYDKGGISALLEIWKNIKNTTETNLEVNEY